MIKKMEQQPDLWKYVEVARDKINELVEFVNKKVPEAITNANGYASCIQTLEEIRIRLELEPFDRFEYKQLLKLNEKATKLVKLNPKTTEDQIIKERYRQTGRTTKILCEALSAMSYGHQVIFAGETLIMTKCINEILSGYVAKLGFDHRLLLSLKPVYHFSRNQPLLGIDTIKIKVFWDHEMP
jgi:hypothetical protein